MVEATSSPGTLHVEPLASGAKAGEEWDAFIGAHPDGTFCHLSGWRTVIADVMGHQPTYLVARGPGGEMAGVLPLFRLQSRLFGSRLVSMPFLNYGGPIGTPEAVDALIRDAVRMAEADGVERLELRTRHPLETMVAPETRKVTVVLPLPQDPEELWKSFKSKVRSQVRRPMKEGLEARIGPEQMEPFYRVFTENMRDLGTPVLPRRLFEAIATTFPDQVVFAAVYGEDGPVAGGAGFAFGDEFEITWASSLRAYNRSAPNMLLYWSLMEEMSRRGVGAFNFGRCTPGEGTHRFKRQWGGEDQPLPWLVWPEEPDDAGEPGRAARLASEAWQKLPLPVANRLGPVVARQLPWW
ncbi:MAG TPA: FemAB family XrtA/PEP-CTERM system-associated protein [Longimicrobiales bacterium]|nr:FemAB family XrtA/PEP-CTERM system-associated protein [Longimicrobiales bacterium]